MKIYRNRFKSKIRHFAKVNGQNVLFDENMRYSYLPIDYKILMSRDGCDIYILNLLGGLEFVPKFEFELQEDDKVIWEATKYEWR